MIMAAHADRAVDIAQHYFSLPLDYSPEIITNLQQLANSAASGMRDHSSVELFKQDDEETEIDAACKVLGAYLGEVIRKLKGGNWAMNEQIKRVGLEIKPQNFFFPASAFYGCFNYGENEGILLFYKNAINPPVRGPGD
ncbi:hypothetical protein ABENE_11680 [Asticcacaulis benevestitus DSM 16100 = ATCC BAA-896]|uniref:Uncharacterized protein n=2 Tax=Asticcacaulis TaxID=76890 RepID=V4RHW3_9CAUL|nr:hypothetical protein ABENE_11680 [Asticcacaulis benevestitus DSM 16100 = ATCC BAA-896]